MIKTKRLKLRKEIIEDANGVQRLLMEPEGRIFNGGIVKKSIDEIEKIIKIILTLICRFLNKNGNHLGSEM
jgi:hypothetical protein